MTLYALLMRYMGIDYGAKRVGIAISDEKGIIAFPHSVIGNDETLIAKIGAIVAEKQIETIILGDTRTERGAANPITPEAENFARKIKEILKIPVQSVFEAWSSMAVSADAQKNKHDDSMAAAFILQRYLDMKRL